MNDAKCVKCGSELHPVWVARTIAFKRKHHRPETPPKVCELCVWRTLQELGVDDGERREP